ncbi:MAG: AgmX/PglI C-terminal domain-containing protein [Kofleriaceae bacterium]
MRLSWFVALAACAAAGKRADTPAGPQPAVAPPTSDTEATAPPQPAPELAHPASPEARVAEGEPGPPPVATASLTPPPGKTGAPTITKGKVEVSGAGKLGGEVVTRYLNKNAANFQLCYEKPLLGNPAIAGSITLVFEIEVSGKVGNAKTTGNMNDEVEKCVAGVASRIAFPKPTKAAVEVSYPMTFGWK